MHERSGSLLSALTRRDRLSTDTAGKSHCATARAVVHRAPAAALFVALVAVLTEHQNINRAIGILSLRNFDPETRTLRKHTAAAAANGNGHAQDDDTIEKNVQGLAQAVLAADEARQAAELVSSLLSLSLTEH